MNLAAILRKIKGADATGFTNRMHGMPDDMPMSMGGSARERFMDEYALPYKGESDMNDYNGAGQSLAEWERIAREEGDLGSAYGREDYYRSDLPIDNFNRMRRELDRPFQGDYPEPVDPRDLEAMALRKVLDEEQFPDGSGPSESMLTELSAYPEKIDANDPVALMEALARLSGRTRRNTVGPSFGVGGARKLIGGDQE